MINENSIFTKVDVPCEKLGKAVPLLVYQPEGDTEKKIVSSNSLEAVFNSVKKQFGASLDKGREPIISFNASGDVVYCAKSVHLTDSEGYDEWETGESTPKTRQSLIAETHPLTTAENRAKSKAIRKYLGLPSFFYSSDEIPVGESLDAAANKQDIKAMITNMGEKAKAAPGKEAASASEEESPVITQAPVGNAIELPSEAGETGETEKKSAKTSKPVQEVSKPAETSAAAEPTPVTETSSEDDLMSVPVTFGAGKGKTVGEVLADPTLKGFVEKVRAGLVTAGNDAAKAKCIEALKATA